MRAFFFSLSITFNAYCLIPIYIMGFTPSGNIIIVLFLLLLCFFTGSCLPPWPFITRGTTWSTEGITRLSCLIFLRSA